MRDYVAPLWRDGTLVLDWRLDGREVLSPADWVDAPLWNGFIPWATHELDTETGEAAVALPKEFVPVDHAIVGIVDDVQDL